MSKAQSLIEQFYLEEQERIAQESTFTPIDVSVSSADMAMINTISKRFNKDKNQLVREALSQAIVDMFSALEPVERKMLAKDADELANSIAAEIAEEQGLVTANKKDSTGICFIGERKFSDFLAQYLPAQPGDIENCEGQIMGTHQGLMYHTLGQRKGLGIGGTKDGDETPWYVVDKDVDRNVLIVGQGHDHHRLKSTALIAGQLHWVDRKPLTETLRCSVKIRYRQQDVPCTIVPLEKGEIKVTFDFNTVRIE